jgi:hypothetical protein
VGEKEENKEKLEKIRTKYKKISEQHGAEIKGVYYIARSEPCISTLFCHMLHLLSYHLHQMPDELLVQQRMKVWMKLLALQISCMVLIYHKFYLFDRQLPGHWWQ